MGKQFGRLQIEVMINKIYHNTFQYQFKVIVALLCLFLLNGNTFYGQTQGDILDYAESRILADPDNAIRMGESVLKHGNFESDRKCKAYFLIAQASMLLEKYDDAYENIFRFLEEKCRGNEEELFRILLFKADLYKRLELPEFENETLDEAENIINRAASSELKKILLWEWQVHQEYKNLMDSLHDSTFKVKVPEIPVGGDSNFLEKRAYPAQKFLNLLAWDSFTNGREFDFEKNYGKYIGEAGKNYPKIYYSYFALSDAYQKIAFAKHKEGVEILDSAKDFLESEPNLSFYKSQIAEKLILEETATRNKEKVLSYRKYELGVQAKADNMAAQTINSILVNKTLNYEKAREASQKKYFVARNIVLVAGLLLSFLLLVIWFRFRWQEKYYKEITSYLKKVSVEETVAEVKAEARPEPQKRKVPLETEEQIIMGLDSFERKKVFLDNNVSLAFLAGRLQVNTKYLSEVLNNSLNENFNGYINRLRIEYIVRKLKDDPRYLHYKISYLAEEAGYSSHSSFTTAFKAVTGVPPTTFIDFLRREK